MIKFKIGRHWLVKALMGVALVATIGFSPHNRVLAGGGSMGKDTEYKSVEGSDDVKFNEDGDIFFETTDKKATNDIRYRTLGFYAALQRTGLKTEVDSLSPS